MDMVSQTGTLERERAHRNHEETLRLLRVKVRARDFLEIGRLLDECKRYEYFKALSYGSFKEYVVSALNRDYANTTCDLRLYLLANRQKPGDPSPELLRKIGRGKAALLLPMAEDHLVSPDEWQKAVKYTWEELRTYVNRYKRHGGPITSEGGVFHKDVQEKVRRIGEMLGRYAHTEYSSGPSKESRYDVVWKTCEHALGATHVFEVCFESSYKKELSNLAYAFRTMGQPRLFLIVEKQETKNKAESFVSHGAGDYAFQNLVVLTAQEIDEFYEQMLRPSSLRDFIGNFVIPLSVSVRPADEH